MTTAVENKRAKQWPATKGKGIAWHGNSEDKRKAKCWRWCGVYYGRDRRRWRL